MNIMKTLLVLLVLAGIGLVILHVMKKKEIPDIPKPKAIPTNINVIHNSGIPSTR